MRHQALGTRHALKLLRVDSASQRRRLLEEGRIQATLRHPNIVRVTDVLDLPQGPGLILDEVDGPSLRARLREGRIPLEQAVALAEGILRGVAAAHRRGLVHRDLKPANVLLETGPDGWIPRVADFGIARAPLGASDSTEPRTRSGTVMGTPGYMAPEQLRDAAVAGPPADVFSLGCLLYELLAGRRPFTGTDLIELFRQATEGAAPPLDQVAPWVPVGLARVVAQALLPSPAARPPDAGALLDQWRRAREVGPPAPPNPVVVTTADAVTLDVLFADLADLAETGSGAVTEARPTDLARAVSLAADTSLVAQDLAVLLVDLADSTAMTAELGPARASAVWAAHDRVARDLLAPHGGREIDKTDGFLLVFETVGHAVRYALDYLHALTQLSDALDRTLASRAGLHRGPVVLRENPPEDIARGAKPIELDGVAKSLAARVMGLARPNQLLLTAPARAAFDPPPGRVVSHWFWQVKGVDEPQELFEVGPPDAPFAPPQGSAKSWRVARVGGAWVPADDLPRHLPPRPDGSVGREVELRQLADALSGGASLVTVLGPGGIGKTHLAVRFAWQWMGAWPGGAWFVDLSDARTAAQVARALAQALDLPVEDGAGIAQVARALSTREAALLVLDNLEQVADPAEGVVGRLLSRAPNVQALATSRHRLYLPGEHLVPLAPFPLPLPGDGVAGRDNPGVQLFVARARATSPGFSLEEAGPEAVVELVRLLDGLPLAIELAAARTRVLAPKALLRRMGRRFDLLKRRGGHGRQRTLRAAIDWSWDLLEPVERAVFASLSVFAGRFDLEAAEAVLDLDDWPDAPWPDELVEALVDKSLVRSEAVDGEMRFSLLPHLRDYAAEKLADPLAVQSPGPDPVTGPAVQARLRARHAAHHARWGDPTSLRRLRGSGSDADRARLAGELDDVIAALRWAFDAGEGVLACRAALGALGLLQHDGPAALAEELAALAGPGAPPALAAELAASLDQVRAAHP